jgi:predicted acyltransferase
MKAGRRRWPGACSKRKPEASGHSWCILLRGETPIATGTEPSVAASAKAALDPASPGAAGGAQRLLSLDVFRGLTIAGMILVNNPGSWSAIYAPLAHAEWHGWTPTDLIFPFFLFIVGVSMPLSFAKRARRGDTRGALLRHAAVRGALIIAVGLGMAAFPFFRLGTLRIPGVLQRIGVCYVLAALGYVWLGKGARLAVICALLLGYWGLLAWVPVPGFGVGRLDVEGNLAAYVDRAVMLGHLWKPSWDPEGILSTLPAIATPLLGSLLGAWLAGPRPETWKQLDRSAVMFAWGAAGLLVGQLWNLWLPINKNLWTSSYVVFTAGFACVLLGVVHLLVDEMGYRKWTAPFVWYGMNPLVLFVFSGLLAKMMGIWKVTAADGRVVSVKGYIYANFFEPLASPKNASLLFALSYVGLWLAIAWMLYRRRIFIKI